MSERKKGLIVAVIVTVVFIAILVVALNVDRWMNPKDESGSGTAENTVTVNGENYYLRKDLSAFLIIGVDAFGEAEESAYWINGQQADFLLLAVFDHTDKRYTLLHLNRDTVTDVDRLGMSGVKVETVKEQLALSHAYGDGLRQSCKNTVTAVSKLLGGIEIDGYLSLTMDAVAIFNDYIGGVTVTLNDDFSALGHPEWVPGKTVTLSGSDALDFVRSRGGVSDGTNLSRMERQRQYLSAVFAKLQTHKVDTSFLKGAYSKVKGYTVANFGSISIGTFASYFNEYTNAGTDTPKGRTSVNEKTGFMEFYPDQEELRTFIVRYFYRKAKN